MSAARAYLTMQGIVLLFLSLATTAQAQISWNMTKLGQLTGGRAQAVVTDGGYAYVAADRVFYVLDVSDPTKPLVTHQEDAFGRARGVALHAGFLYLARGTDGVRVFDLVDQAVPVEVGGYDTPGEATFISFVGSTMYVADGSGGVVILDASVPASPTFVGSYSEPLLYVSHLQVVGTTVYAAAHRFELDIFIGELRLLDVADPAAPVLLHTQSFGIQDGTARVIVDGSVVYFSEGWNVQQLLQLSATQFLPLQTLDVGEVHDLRLLGSQLWVGGAFDVSVYQVGSGSYSELGSLEVQGRGGAFDIVGTKIYRTGSEMGVQVIDASDVTQMAVLGEYRVVSSPTGVTVGGSRAYLLDKSLWAVDVSDPSHPATTDEQPVWARDFTVATDVGFSVSATEVSSYDLSEGTFDVISSLPLSGSPSAQVYRSGLVYIADYLNGLTIVDVSNPLDMHLLSTLSTETQLRAVAVAGHVVYTSNNSSGLNIVDASDLAHPVDVVSIPMTVNDLEVAQGRLFVASGSSGVRVYDIANPFSPVFVTTVGQTPGGWTSHVRVRGNHLFLADSQDAGSHVYDISDLQQPVEVGYHLFPSSITGLEVVGRTVYVSVLGSGLYVVEIDAVVTSVEEDDALTSRLGSYPNPFRSRTNISFRPSYTGSAQLELYDLAGRLVRSWEPRVRAGMPMSVQWDGRDARGHAVSSGVYFYRLTTPQSSYSNRVTLLR